MAPAQPLPQQSTIQMVLRAGRITSRSPGFDVDTLIANLSSPAFVPLLGRHQAGITSIHTQEGSKAHSPFTLMKTPHRSRRDALSSSEAANSTINTDHNKAMITAAPRLDATKGALPHKKGLVGHFPQEYPELHLPGPAAPHVLHPQLFLQHLELNFSHQVHDQPHLPPSC